MERATFLNKILVAEDDPSILRIVTIALAKLRIKVVGAADGEAALRLVEQERPDAVILDIQLPKIDGFAVCKKLKENQDTANIPVGFLSAQAENQNYDRAKQLGGLMFLPKPFHPDRLASFVQVLLASRKEI